jgi:methionine biosynthesis protein MetW
MNDNRNYRYDINSVSNREEYCSIMDWIPKGSKVIDLGCGDGSLLLLLQEKGITGTGIEISKSGVVAARKKRLKVRQGRIDEKLDYRDKQFDYAICNMTLQMVMRPERLLLEMSRIAHKQIVSFPNFAYFLNRLDLLFNGRMPKYMIPGYKWYSTGHIHQLSVGDFLNYCRTNSIKIIDKKYIFPKKIFGFRIPAIIQNTYPNLFSYTAIFLTE